MWIFKKLSNLLSILPSSLTIYLVCMSLGVGLGGYSVHKLYELKELAVLKEQAAQQQADRAARIASARHAAQLALKASQQLDTTKRKIAAHVPHTPACRLNPDAVRLLNDLRGEM